MKNITYHATRQRIRRSVRQAACITTALISLPIGALMLNHTAYAEAEAGTDIHFALSALREACEPYVSAAGQSLEAADLALYCLSTGETIVLQAAKNLQQQQQETEGTPYLLKQREDQQIDYGRHEPTDHPPLLRLCPAQLLSTHYPSSSDLYHDPFHKSSARHVLIQ